jgi:hypothetical protein
MDTIGSAQHRNIRPVIHDEQPTGSMGMFGEGTALVEVASTEFFFVAVLENSHASSQQRFNHNGQRNIWPQRRIENRIERGFAEQLL